jgi:predicted DNA-binding protein
MQTKRDKVSRSLKLEADINDRLIKLCEHLGVNPNAYLLNEVGKAISRDEITLVASNNTRDMVSGVMSMFGELVSLDSKEKVITDK